MIMFNSSLATPVLFSVSKLKNWNTTSYQWVRRYIYFTLGAGFTLLNLQNQQLSSTMRAQPMDAVACYPKQFVCMIGL